MSGEQRITVEVLMPQLPGDPPGRRRIEEARTPERFAQLVELAWRAAELRAAEARELLEAGALAEWSDSHRHVHYWFADPVDQLTAESHALIAAGLAASPYDRGMAAPWDRADGCFGHCDPEGWWVPCRHPAARAVTV